MQSDTLYAVLGAGSSAVAAAATWILAMRSRLAERQATAAVRRATKELQGILAAEEVSEAQKAKIRVLLAEAELWRIGGQSERAKEAERETQRLLKNHARLAGDEAP
ncbi:hypothetical protein [Streptomyces sp. NPDC005799]|uniref:hypothetical protein n=1 Tax=Streptomyces sp. NPDC005799 TaxID=3154678 RepID=UPI0033C0417E